MITAAAAQEATHLEPDKGAGQDVVCIRALKVGDRTSDQQLSILRLIQKLGFQSVRSFDIQEGVTSDRTQQK